MVRNNFFSVYIYLLTEIFSDLLGVSFPSGVDLVPDAFPFSAFTKDCLTSISKSTLGFLGLGIKFSVILS